MGTETIIQVAMERRNLPALYGALPFLRELDAKLLQEISDEIEWFSLPGGAVLYEAGQEADALYIVINGALASFASSAAGALLPVGQILARELAGEMELISGSRRSLTVVAARDTEVARVPQPLFARIVERDAACLVQLARSLAGRLEALQLREKNERAAKRIFAVVPHDSAGCDAAEFGSRLAGCLRKFGSVEIVLKANAADKTSQWYHRIEKANDFVVYVADSRPTNWTRLCMRQAHTALLLASQEQEARPWRVLGDSDLPAAAGSCELVLLRRGSTGAAGSARWLALHPDLFHHQVQDASDMARLARLLTGRATGVVLSGGGARGFAHIGALRALQESAVAVDAVGGTSIGAIIAALWATGMDYGEVVKCVRGTFVDVNPLNDYTLPMLSLVAGHKVGALLRRQFGETDIEDLRLPFYCVSANLTTGQAAVHRRGKLWLWLRASIAIPGVLPPVCTGRQIYVDGATINNLPVDVMRETISGRVVGIDVGADHNFESDVELTEMPLPWRLFSWARGRRPRINIMQVLWRAGMVNSAAMTLGQRASADLLLKPPLGQIDLLDWQSFDRVVEIGYRHAMGALERRAADAPAGLQGA